MQKPDVSVLVPVYNGERYLAECLQSIIQNEGNIEILVLNNGSTDRTLEIAEQFQAKDSRIKIFSHDNLGQGGNLNDGLLKATGFYVCEVDADDYIALDHIEKLYADGIVNGSDVVKCGYVEFWGTKNHRKLERSHSNLPGPSYMNRNINVRTLDDMELPALINRAPSVFAGIYRRKFLIDNGLFWRPDKNFEDTSLMFRIATTAGRFRWANSSTYYHRADNPSSGTSTIFDFEGLSEQFEEMHRHASSIGLECHHWIEVNRFYSYLWMFNRCRNAEEQTQFMKIFLRDMRRYDHLPGYLFNTPSDYDMYLTIRPK